MVVAVDGTKPACVAGGRLQRLLRGALLAFGLSALTWLLTMVVGTGTAAADASPSGQSTPPRSGGLLGGLLGTVGGVLNTATSAIGQLTGAVLNTVPPILSEPPPAPEIPQPQPKPARIDLPAPARPSPNVIIPIERPAPVATPAPAPVTSPAPPPAVPVAHKPAAPAPAPVVHHAVPLGTEQADPSAPNRAPGKAPTAPPTPAAPASCTSGSHDGPGGTHGVLAGQPGISSPAKAFTTRGRAGDAGGRAAGLPAASPD